MIPVSCKYWHLKRRGKVLCYSLKYFQWSVNTMDIPTIMHLKITWTSSALIIGRCSLLLFLLALIFLFLLSHRSWDFPGSSHGKESACSVGDLGWIHDWEDPLEEGMATHSSILAWRIPWTEEAGGLQSMGSQRVWHNWVTKHTHRILSWSKHFSAYKNFFSLSFSFVTIKFSCLRRSIMWDPWVLSLILWLIVAVVCTSYYILVFLHCHHCPSCPAFWPL